MLFAEAPNIIISLDAAIAMGVGIAGGLTGGAKVLVWSFQKIMDHVLNEVKDNRDEIKENREAHKLVTASLINLHKESLASSASFQVAMNKLIDRMDTQGHQKPVT